MPRFLINIIFILTFFQTVGQNRNTAGGGQSYTYDNIYATRSYDKEDKFLGSTYLFSEWNNNGIFYVQGKSYRIDNIDAVEGTFNLAKGAYDKTKYKISNRYFVKEGDDILLFNPGKNVVLDIFKENKDAVKKFAKKNKLSYKKETDLIKIFKFYNEI